MQTIISNYINLYVPSPNIAPSSLPPRNSLPKAPSFAPSVCSKIESNGKIIFAVTAAALIISIVAAAILGGAVWNAPIVLFIGLSLFSLIHIKALRVCKERCVSVAPQNANFVHATQRESINHPSKTISNGLSIGSRPKLEEFVQALKNEQGVTVRGDMADTWHEVVFDDNSYAKSKVNCTWKLHISPGSDTIAVLGAIRPVLIKNRPYCKIVQNQEKLTNLQNSPDINGKYVYKGKCLTIYPRSEQEALSLAIELNNAINQSHLINNDKMQQPCTDRPLGLSGYLWSRNDLAGGPIDEQSFQSSDHAHAMPGNYDTTVILPMEAFDFDTTENGRVAYVKWYDREFPNFRRIIHRDIFRDAFGSVHWVGNPESDQGRFETHR